VAAHDQSSRYSEEKVAQIKSRLHQTRFHAIQRKALHELADQYIVQIVGHAPHEEQRSDQTKGQKLPACYKRLIAAPGIRD
jgi:hypothetical protein